MSPVQHPVAGRALTFSLAREMETVRQELASAPSRAARTLVKEGALRLTLIGVKPGGGLHPHKADGPIAVQVLEGSIEMEVDGQRIPLETGALLALDGGVTHAVSSAQGGFFLLTVAGRPD